jgi:hypothetical protein
MAEQLIKVTRPFCINGQRREVGDVLPVDAKFAAELRALRKAEFTTQPSVKPAAKAANKES